MKKFFALLIALVCVFAVAFTACNNTGEDSGTANNEQNIDDSQTDDEQFDNEQPDEEQTNDKKPYNKQPDDEQPDNKQPYVEQPDDKEPDNEQPDEEEHSNEQPQVEQPNVEQPNEEQPETIKSYAIGDKLPGFTIKTYNSSYTDGTYSSANAHGKVLVINFWFRSCGPCIGELPYFEQVNREYGDQVEIVAIHSNNGEQPIVQSFINSQGWSDWKMIFGKDVGTNELYYKFAVSKGTYPVTIVVNPEGYITYTCVGTLRTDLLRGAINRALGK